MTRVYILRSKIGEAEEQGTEERIEASWTYMEKSA